MKPNTIGVQIFLSPYFDAAKQKFLVGDNEYDSEPVRKHTGEIAGWYSTNCPLPLSSTKSISFTHGDVFDLDDPIDQVKLQVIKDQGFLAGSMRDVNPGRHRFYVEDKAAMAKESVDTGNKIADAVMAIKDMTPDQLADFAYVEKQPVSSMTTTEIQGFAFGLAQTNPGRVLELVSDKKFKVVAFISKLVHYGILTVEAGQYRYGKELIGTSLDSAVGFLSRADNKSLGQLLQGELKKKIRTEPSEEGVEAEE